MLYSIIHTVRIQNAPLIMTISDQEKNDGQFDWMDLLEKKPVAPKADEKVAQQKHSQTASGGWKGEETLVTRGAPKRPKSATKLKSNSYWQALYFW